MADFHFKIRCAQKY